MNTRMPSLEDIQTVQVKREALLKVSNFLEMNQEVIGSMKTGFEMFPRQENGGQGTDRGEADFEKTAIEDFMATLDEHLMRMSNHQKRALNLIKRCDGLAMSVSLVLQYMHSYLRAHSIKIPSMLASRDNCIMWSIQNKATQHSRSMKIITAVTLVYFPASFAAVCSSPSSNVHTTLVRGLISTIDLSRAYSVRISLRRDQVNSLGVPSTAQ